LSLHVTCQLPIPPLHVPHGLAALKMPVAVQFGTKLSTSCIYLLLQTSKQINATCANSDKEILLKNNYHLYNRLGDIHFEFLIKILYIFHASPSKQRVTVEFIIFNHNSLTEKISAPRRHFPSYTGT
jgi:hypothetical protein